MGVRSKKEKSQLVRVESPGRGGGGLITITTAWSDWIEFSMISSSIFLAPTQDAEFDFECESWTGVLTLLKDELHSINLAAIAFKVRAKTTSGTLRYEITGY